MKSPLLIIGATRNNRYVEIRETDIVARFGVHESRFQIFDITSSGPIKWHIWNDIGLRVHVGKTLGLIGSLSGVVERDLNTEGSQEFLGVTCGQIAFSLEAPEGFLSAITMHSH